jgi:uncharacterized SAM-binding protein YcdF (DUF218 family)
MGRFLFGFVLGAASVIVALAGVGHYLAIADPIAHADAIIAISGDTGARTDTAVILWKQGYAPVIIFSGASQDPQSVALAEPMKRAAVAAGVPADAIVIEPESATTEENATNVAELMHARNLRTAILVTSPYHQRRASILFEREFDRRGGITFRNHPADDPDWDANVWWTRDPSRTRTLVELAKLGALVAGQRAG